MLTAVPGDGSGHEGGKDGSPSLVRAGARFERGVLIERSERDAA